MINITLLIVAFIVLAGSTYWMNLLHRQIRDLQKENLEIMDAINSVVGFLGKLTGNEQFTRIASRGDEIVDKLRNL